MRKTRAAIFKTSAAVSLALLAACGKTGGIDRKAVVDRHSIITTATDPKSPAQVGNGQFAFGVDITGLQSFVPFNTMSQWSWHSVPLPEGWTPGDYRPMEMEMHGRMMPSYIPNPEQPEISHWLKGNPHRFNLGRIGMRMLKKDGAEASESDITDARQRTDMWEGIIYSTFKLDGEEVKVVTACHPAQDAVGVRIESPLVADNRIEIFFDFPYTEQSPEFSDYVGEYDRPDRHTSALRRSSASEAVVERTMDDAHYYTALRWDSPASFAARNEVSPHRFSLTPSGGDRIEFTCSYLRDEPDELPLFREVEQESKKAWKAYWKSGAAIDLSASTDPRWKELERRIVLSQYVMKVNEAGELPPQESGLVNNGWYGRFHFEMIWWHCVHYALWDRWNETDEALDVYRRFLPTSRERAAQLGYSGVRWPKCTGDIDRDWPHIIHVTLIWQQPHPIYFAELDYRLHPTAETLDKWKEVVFASADFMADFAFFDKDKGHYVLGPPLFIVSENTRPEITTNPAFELSYWRFGLRMAQEWSKRLGVSANKKWAEVLDKLAPLPVEEGVYVTYEGIDSMWSKYTFEHPALTGVYGMLPGDGVDMETFDRTLNKVREKWDFNRTWGWDFPMLAMAAARIGHPEMAVDFLLHESPNFQFDAHGLASGGPHPYFPSNGALLTAVAMMIGGWDGSEGEAPGFPKDGSWSVKHEGFNKMP